MSLSPSALMEEEEIECNQNFIFSFLSQTKAADLGNHTSICSLVYSFRF